MIISNNWQIHSIMQGQIFIFIFLPRIAKNTPWSKKINFAALNFVATVGIPTFPNENDKRRV